MRRKGRESKFKALLAPARQYICIAFLGLILVLMCTIDGMRLSGDPAAGVDPVYRVYRLQTAAPPRSPWRGEIQTRPSGGAFCGNCDPLRRRRICLHRIFIL